MLTSCRRRQPLINCQGLTDAHAALAMAWDETRNLLPCDLERELKSKIAIINDSLDTILDYAERLEEIQKAGLI